MMTEHEQKVDDAADRFDKVGERFIKAIRRAETAGVWDVATAANIAAIFSAMMSAAFSENPDFINDMSDAVAEVMDKYDDEDEWPEVVG